MKKQLLRVYTAVVSFVTAMILMTVPALAAVPLTGDERGQRMGLIIGLLVVSAIVVVGVLIFTGKKKK